MHTAIGLLILLIFVSAFFSTSETALFSLGKLDLKKLSKSTDKAWTEVQKGVSHAWDELSKSFKKDSIESPDSR